MVPKRPKKRKAGRLLLEDGEVLIKTYTTITPVFTMMMICAVGIGVVGLVELLVGRNGSAIGPLSTVSLGLITAASSFGTIKYHLTNRRLAQENCSGKLPQIKLEEINEIRLEEQKKNTVTVCTSGSLDRQFSITSRKALEVAQEIQTACSKLAEA